MNRCAPHSLGAVLLTLLVPAATVLGAAPDDASVCTRSRMMLDRVQTQEVTQSSERIPLDAAFDAALAAARACWAESPAPTGPTLRLHLTAELPASDATVDDGRVFTLGDAHHPFGASLQLIAEFPASDAHDEKGASPYVDIRVDRQRQPPVPLELGGALDGVSLFGLDPTRFRVEFRVQSALVVGDEGPHLDLRRFVHGHSPWRPLALDVDGHALVPSLPAPPPLPRFSASALTRAIEEATPLSTTAERARWMALALERCQNGGCTTIDEVQVRVMKKTATGWTEEERAIIVFPMGC